jgi:hypothetical protein
MVIDEYDADRHFTPPFMIPKNSAFFSANQSGEKKWQSDKNTLHPSPLSKGEIFHRPAL